ncbi:ribbon-helix-helix domain-containing protein [Falsiroseomonas stagni]|uniref:Antitoxin ParD1/3/4 n=1 Tax=Falsiroseomonas stagni DSM 19981 TaxID=1123062 RepID=A0A1I4CTK9_9PROT|nr:plasmid stabilization protein [Falsiroseomonas stagni]SFK84103.1 antitoxin ParD1/3/4 [Falsiroseomonas stagni DSM 19981]
MAAAEKRTVSVPPDQILYSGELVATGGYASASQVVRAGLRERDAAVNRWLRDEVAPVQDAMQADPGKAVDADAVGAALRAHHAARLKPGRLGA